MERSLKCHCMRLRERRFARGVKSSAAPKTRVRCSQCRLDLPSADTRHLLAGPRDAEVEGVPTHRVLRGVMVQWQSNGYIRCNLFD